jgi:hypothetical protein
MLLLLVATLGGRWSFDGFASDPSRPVSVKPGSAPPAPASPGPVRPTPAVASPPTTHPAPAVELIERPSVEDKSPPHPKPSPPGTTEAKAPTRPISWRLADVSGQIWEHPDPEWLRCWVAQRNARLAASRVAPRYDPAMNPPDGTCPSGRRQRPR